MHDVIHSASSRSTGSRETKRKFSTDEMEGIKDNIKMTLIKATF